MDITLLGRMINVLGVLIVSIETGKLLERVTSRDERPRACPTLRYAKFYTISVICNPEWFSNDII